jgi:hypothetical protein
MASYGRFDAGSITHKGVTVAIEVDGDGRWHAKVGNDYFSEETRDKLSAKIATAAKKATVNVSVPFTQLSTGQGYGAGDYTISVRSGTATGIHSSNGNVLVTWESGNKEQLRNTGTTSIALSDDKRKEFVRLANEAKAAKNALNKFLDAHKMDLRGEVSAAQEKTTP